MSEEGLGSISATILNGALHFRTAIDSLNNLDGDCEVGVMACGVIEDELQEMRARLELLQEGARSEVLGPEAQRALSSAESGDGMFRQVLRGTSRQHAQDLLQTSGAVVQVLGEWHLAEDIQGEIATALSRLAALVEVVRNLRQMYAQSRQMAVAYAATAQLVTEMAQEEADHY